jgi:5-methylcytosine-specific restriction endonuclease McrA
VDTTPHCGVYHFGEHLPELNNSAYIREVRLVTRRSWRAEIFEAWNHSCAYCGEDAKSLDHVNAKSNGGLTVVKNLVACCLNCNRRKGDREVFEWFRKQSAWSLLREQKLIDWING